MIYGDRHYPQSGERASPVGVMALHTLMRDPVNFDDEAKLGAREVDNVIGDNELPAKPNTELGAREAAPEELLGGRRCIAHTTRLFFEPSCASW